MGGIGDALALLVLVLLAAPGGGRRGLLRRRLPRARPSPSPPSSVRGSWPRCSSVPYCSGPLTALTAPGGPARPPLDHDRRGRAAARAARSSRRCGSTGRRTTRSRVAAGHRLRDRRRRAVLDGRQGGAAPALLPAPPPGGRDRAPAAGPPGRAAPALRCVRASSRMPARGRRSASSPRCVSNLLGSGIDWFGQHQAALGSYVAAGLFAASVSSLYFLELPDAQHPARAVAAGGPAPPQATGTGAGQGPYGRDPAAGARPAPRSPGRSPPPSPSPCCTPTTWAAARSASALLVLALTGGTGRRHPRAPPHVLPALSRRRLLALAHRLHRRRAARRRAWCRTSTTVLLIALLAGLARGRRRQHRAHAARPGDRGVPAGPDHRAPAGGRPGRRRRSARSSRPLLAAVDRPAPRWRAASSSSPTAAPRSR